MYMINKREVRNDLVRDQSQFINLKTNKKYPPYDFSGSKMFTSTFL